TAGERGRVDATVKNITSGWWSDFAEVPGPEWRVASLAVKGQWDNGPMTFTGDGDLSMPLATDRLATIKIAARGDAQGVKIDTLDVVEGSAPIFTARGSLPLKLQPREAASLV